MPSLAVILYPLAYVLFAALGAAWIAFELGLRPRLWAEWRWIAAAVTVGIAGTALFALDDSRVGNFLLHASGGVSAACLFVYLSRTLGLGVNWRLATGLLFAFVCLVGVLNELAEFLLELLGFGMFSWDRLDTWRDLAANTTGALAAWALILPFGLLRRRSAHHDNRAAGL